MQGQSKKFLDFVYFLIFELERRKKNLLEK
jgi:hypothetical protein